MQPPAEGHSNLAFNGDGHSNLAFSGDGHSNLAFSGDGHSNLAFSGDGHSNLAFSGDVHHAPPSYFSLQPLPVPLAPSPPAAHVPEMAVKEPRAQGGAAERSTRAAHGGRLH
eukprot:TRINITY_DN16255_c0_g1_i1.p4 TRINITY_DN16255_c0_g1~~TRINITY_DN16255_c0_g1_i1.p4  ORF type:complete len:112 (-),score=32.37 TRINITY_DN16255_c0_g1_i1:8-343(-)